MYQNFPLPLALLHRISPTTHREKTASDPAYVSLRMIPGPGCGSSYVGNVTARPFVENGVQHLNISNEDCLKDRVLWHELWHAFGFFHEQSRPDRDDFVKINVGNIVPGLEGNFRIARGSLTFGLPYDGRSFMHYSSRAFSRTGAGPTIESKV